MMDYQTNDEFIAGEINFVHICQVTRIQVAWLKLLEQVK